MPLANPHPRVGWVNLMDSEAYMHYLIDLTKHLEQLAQALAFEVQPIGQIELEGLMLDITDGAPLGLLSFDINGFTIHPVLLMATLPAFTNRVAELAGIEEQGLDNPVSWIDAGYCSTGAVLTALFSDAAQKLMVWSSSVIEDQGYCPIEVLLNSVQTGESFEQAKVRTLFRESGLRPIAGTR